MTAGAAFKSLLSGPLLKRIFAASVIAVAVWIAVQTFLGKDPRSKAAPSAENFVPRPQFVYLQSCKHPPS
jgi:uncharacterized membrane protein YfcA